MSQSDSKNKYDDNQERQKDESQRILFQANPMTAEQDRLGHQCQTLFGRPVFLPWIGQAQSGRLLGSGKGLLGSHRTKPVCGECLSGAWIGPYPAGQSSGCREGLSAGIGAGSGKHSLVA